MVFGQTFLITRLTLCFSAACCLSGQHGLWQEDKEGLLKPVLSAQLTIAIVSTDNLFSSYISDFKTQSEPPAYLPIYLIAGFTF